MYSDGGNKRNQLDTDYGGEYGDGGRPPRSVIMFLASSGARVNEKDKYGLTPLHYAAMRGNEDATVELLTCKGIDIEVMRGGEKGLTMLQAGLPGSQSKKGQAKKMMLKKPKAFS